MTGEIDIVGQLITVAPVVGVLFWVIFYFRGEIKEYKAEIKELNTTSKEDAVESITVIKDLNTTLKELIVEIKTSR